MCVYCTVSNIASFAHCLNFNNLCADSFQMACSSSETTTEVATVSTPVVTLRLVPKTKVEGSANAVTWDSSVVDNEHLGKKSSKKCCIFHKARGFGESDSDESDSDWEGFDDFAPRKAAEIE